MLEYLRNKQKFIIFVPDKKVKVMKLSITEKELIETLRIYRKAYPNGKKMLEKEIDELIDILMDHQYNEKEDRPKD